MYVDQQRDSENDILAGFFFFIKGNKIYFEVILGNYKSSDKSDNFHMKSI